MSERIRSSEKNKSISRRIGVALLNIMNRMFELTGLKKNEKRR